MRLLSVFPTKVRVEENRRYFTDDFPEVKKIVDTRLDNDAPEIYTVGKELKEFLSEDRLTAWAQLAANYEQCSEIIAFLGELKRRFNTHCLENGL